MIVVDPQGELIAHIKHFAAVTGHHRHCPDPVSGLSPHFNLSSHGVYIGGAGHRRCPSSCLHERGSESIWQKARRRCSPPV
jgi:hypothetical protein